MKTLIISEVEKFIPHLKEFLTILEGRKLYASSKVLNIDEVLNNKVMLIGVANINNQTENIYVDNSDGKAFEILSEKSLNNGLEELNLVNE